MRAEYIIILVCVLLSLSSQALHAEAKHITHENSVVQASSNKNEDTTHNNTATSCSWWDNRCATK